jgi:hypothetical protein
MLYDGFYGSTYVLCRRRAGLLTTKKHSSFHVFLCRSRLRTRRLLRNMQSTFERPSQFSSNTLYRTQRTTTACTFEPSVILFSMILLRVKFVTLTTMVQGKQLISILSIPYMNLAFIRSTSHGKSFMSKANRLILYGPELHSVVACGACRRPTRDDRDLHPLDCPRLQLSHLEVFGQSKRCGKPPVWRYGKCATVVGKA